VNLNSIFESKLILRKEKGTMNSNIVMYGNIYTVDKKNPKASALAISDGKFYLNGQLFFKRLLQGQENILYSFTMNYTQILYSEIVSD
jgi:hypothetical protein